MIKHLKLHIIWSISTVLLIPGACQNTETAETQVKAPPQDRNLPGIGVPRGLISKTSQATPGYVYFSPLLSDTTFLINMDGEVVHTWKSDYGPSGWVYLRENGNLARGGKDPEKHVFEGGGAGGYFQEFNWDGDLVWEYKISSSINLVHHDVAIMPNGNYLAIAWEGKTAEEAIAMGRDPQQTPEEGVWPDWVVELKPKGPTDAEIVWEWHLWDHMIQDFDSTKMNFGRVVNHPELLDINLVISDDPEDLDQDLFHTNAINYNPELDQIVLSSPELDEIIIIDHSTTSEEASGHNGGRWGKGGDILYRWGNPENYRKGSDNDQKLGGQHDVQWIKAGFPGEGNLLVYNNNVPQAKPGYSSVLELVTPLTESGYELNSEGKFGPKQPAWSYLATDTLSFYSPFISGAHRMSNGNTFITEGARGRFMEVSAYDEILWEYMTPYAGYARLPDGSFPQPVGPHEFAVFRATHIPVDHPAIAGKLLKAIKPQPKAYVPEKKPENNE